MIFFFEILLAQATETDKQQQVNLYQPVDYGISFYS